MRSRVGRAPPYDPKVQSLRRFFSPGHAKVENDFGWRQLWDHRMLPVEGQKDLIDSLCHLLGEKCSAAHRTDVSRDMLYNHLNRASRAPEHPGDGVPLRMAWAPVEAAF